MATDKTPDHQGYPLEQQKRLERMLSERLNPDGTRPQIDAYISSTLEYIRTLTEKMENAADREQASEEIANDLKQKLEGWAAQREANTH